MYSFYLLGEAPCEVPRKKKDGAKIIAEFKCWKLHQGLLMYHIYQGKLINELSAGKG